MIIEVDEKSEKVQKNLDIIKRRIEWIKTKKQNSKSALTAEKDALEWAVTLIEEGVDTTEYAKLYQRYLREKSLEKAKAEAKAKECEEYIREVMTAVVA